jgi:tetratricopeptide (TPR) repeat protein
MNSLNKAKKLLVEGEKHFKDGDYRLACKVYEHVVEIDANNAEAHNSWARALTMLWNYKDAITVFKKLAELKPVDVDYSLLSSALKNVEDTDEDITELSDLIKVCDNAEIWNKWANTLSSVGRYIEALKWYRKAVRREPKRAQFQYELSKTLFQLDKYKESIEWQCKAIKKDPEPADLDSLANSLKELDWEEALVKRVERVIKKSDNANVWSRWASVLGSREKYREAIDWDCKAMEKEPIDLNSLANSLKELDWEEALVKQVEKAIQKRDSTNVWRQWARALRSHKKYTESIDWHCKAMEKNNKKKKVIKKKPEPAKYKQQKGLSNVSLRKYAQYLYLSDLANNLKELDWEKKLTKQVEDAIQKSDSAEVWSRWASELRSHEKHRESNHWLFKAIEKETEPASIAEHYCSWGTALRDINKYRQAVSKYKKAIEKDSSFVPGYVGIGRALAVMGPYDEAVTQFKEAIKIKPDTQNAYIGLIDLLPKLQKRESFKTEMNRLMGRVVNTNVMSQWAEALASIEAYPEAVEWYIKIMNKAPDSARLYSGLEKPLSQISNPEQAIIEVQKTIDKLAIQSHGNNGETLLLLLVRMRRL